MKKIKSKKSIAKKKILDKDYDIAYDFATKVYKQFKEVIKSIVLFGSVAKAEAVQKSDIDIIIIVDDVSVHWDQELIAWYREELGKLIESQKYKKEIHINTVTLSVFWEEIRAGEPVTINILRYGKPLIDFGGFFEPLKILLAKGRIRPTPESVFTTLRRAPTHLARSKVNILSSIEGLYWGMVDAAHAALMAANQIPPSPEHIGEMLTEVFVKNKKLNSKFVKYFDEMERLSKNIMHGHTKSIRGKDIDDHTSSAEDFVKEMTDLTEKLIQKEKIIKVEKKK